MLSYNACKASDKCEAVKQMYPSHPTVLPDEDNIEEECEISSESEATTEGKQETNPATEEKIDVKLDYQFLYAKQLKFNGKLKSRISHMELNYEKSKKKVEDFIRAIYKTFTERITGIIFSIILIIVDVKGY
eukprot:Awhi_evm1s14778